MSLRETFKSVFAHFGPHAHIFGVIRKIGSCQDLWHHARHSKVAQTFLTHAASYSTVFWTFLAGPEMSRQSLQCSAKCLEVFPKVWPDIPHTLKKLEILGRVPSSVPPGLVDALRLGLLHRYACTYVQLDIYVCTSKSYYIHVPACACLRVCVSACLRVCVSACLRVCVSACLRVCVSACLHVCMSECLQV